MGAKLCSRLKICIALLCGVEIEAPYRRVCVEEGTLVVLVENGGLVLPKRWATASDFGLLFGPQSPRPLRNGTGDAKRRKFLSIQGVKCTIENLH